MIKTNPLTDIKKTQLLDNKQSLNTQKQKNIYKNQTSAYDTKGLSLAFNAKYIPPKINFGSASSEIAKILDKFPINSKEILKIKPELTKIFKSDDFCALDEIDKEICETAAIMLSVAKQDGIEIKNICKEYPDLANILKDPRAKSRLEGIFKSSDFIEELKKKQNPTKALDGNDSIDYGLIKDYAINFRRTGDLKIANILMKNGLFGNCDQSVLEDSIKVLEKSIHKIHQNGIWVPQTRIPSASMIKKTPVIIGKEDKSTKNTVIDFFADNLEDIGFKKGSSKDNFSILGLAVDEEEFSPWLIDYVSKEGTNSLLSTSFFEGDKFPTFRNRKFGFFLDAPHDNIALADKTNMASGYAKDFIDFKNRLIFATRAERTNFSDNFCEILGIDKKEYAQIYESIANMRSFDDVQDKKIKIALKKAIEKTYKNKNDGINEIVTYCPKISALFSKAKNIEDIPYALRKYAQDKNIPIMDISKT